jgi:hypothetical protein
VHIINSRAVIVKFDEWSAGDSVGSAVSVWLGARRQLRWFNLWRLSIEPSVKTSQTAISRENENCSFAIIMLKGLT